MEATWQLYQALEGNLYETECIGDGVDMAQTYSNLVQGRRSFNMYEFYANFWRPFGSLLTDMEHKGVLADQTTWQRSRKLRRRTRLRPRPSSGSGPRRGFPTPS